MTGRIPMLEDPVQMPKVEHFLTLIAEKRMSAKGAARRAGIGERSVYQWLEKAGEEGAPECYALFAQRFTQARGEREEMIVDAIATARVYDSEGKALELDWRAQAWLLERLEPEEYGKKDRLELGGDVTLKLLQVATKLPEQD